MAYGVTGHGLQASWCHVVGPQTRRHFRQSVSRTVGQAPRLTHHITPTLQRRQRRGSADHQLSGHQFDNPLDGRPRSRRQPHSRPLFCQPPRSLRMIATRWLQRASGPPPLSVYRLPNAATRREQARDTRRLGQLPLNCARQNSSRSTFRGPSAVSARPTGPPETSDLRRTVVESLPSKDFSAAHRVACFPARPPPLRLRGCAFEENRRGFGRARQSAASCTDPSRIA